MRASFLALALLLAGCSAVPVQDTPEPDAPPPPRPTGLEVSYGCTDCRLEVGPDPWLDGIALDGQRAAVVASGMLTGYEYGWQVATWVRDGDWTRLPLPQRPDSDEPVRFPDNGAGQPAFVDGRLVVPLTLEDGFPPGLVGGNVPPPQVVSQAAFYVGTAAPPYDAWALEQLGGRRPGMWPIAALPDGAVVHSASTPQGTALTIAVPEGDVWRTTPPFACSGAFTAAVGEGWYVGCAATSESFVAHVTMEGGDRLDWLPCPALLVAPGPVWVGQGCPLVVHWPEASLALDAPWTSAPGVYVTDVDVDAWGFVHLMVTTSEPLVADKWPCRGTIRHVAVSPSGIVHDAVVADISADCSTRAPRGVLATDGESLLIAYSLDRDTAVTVVDGTLTPAT